MHSKRITATLAILLAIPATADIIFDCGGAGGIAIVSGNYGIFEIAPFQVGTDATATGIIWYGGYGESMDLYGYGGPPGMLLDNVSPPGADGFSLGIIPNVLDYGVVWEMMDGMAALSLVGGITRSPTGYVDNNGIHIYRYSAAIAPSELHAGTWYGLGITNFSYEDPGVRWGWSTGRGGESWFLSIYNGDFHFVGGPAGFYLTDDDPIVPEPATFSLLGLGLAALATRFRKILA